MATTLLIGLAAAVGVFALIFIGSTLLTGAGRGSPANRLSKYESIRATLIEERKSRKKRERSKATDMLVHTVDRIVENQSFAEKLRGKLSRADLRFTVGEYLIL